MPRIIDVITAKRDHVGSIEINRPPANYFDRELIGDIADAATRLEEQGVRAIVLCSAGKHFCAGANFANGATVPERVDDSKLLYGEALRIFRVGVPIIAATQGAAVGGGLGLACAADFRVGSRGSRFHANFTSLGFHPGFGLTVTLPAIVGAQHATDMFYSSRRIDGERAATIGLLDRLVSDGEVRAEAFRWAAEIAKAAPLAVRSVKQTLRSARAEEVEQALEHELEQQSHLWSTEDCRIGIAASLERREANFVGR